MSVRGDGFFPQPHGEDAEWKLNIHIQFCFCGNRPLENIICAATKRKTGEEWSATHPEKVLTMMTCRQKLQPESASNHFRLLFMTPRPALFCSGSYLLHNFGGKKYNKVSSEKKGSFHLTVTQPLLCRCTLLFCLVIMKISKSLHGHCRVTKTDGLVLYSIVDSLSLFFLFGFVSVQLDEEHFTPCLLPISFMQMHEPIT